MADPIKPVNPVLTPAIPAPFKFDEDAFQTKVISQEEFLKKHIGLKGHNPFFLLYKLLDARKSYSEGNRTPELYNYVMNMEQKAPTYGAPTLVAASVPNSGNKVASAKP